MAETAETTETPPTPPSFALVCTFDCRLPLMFKDVTNDYENRIAGYFFSDIPMGKQVPNQRFQPLCIKHYFEIKVMRFVGGIDRTIESWAGYTYFSIPLLNMHTFKVALQLSVLAASLRPEFKTLVQEIEAETRSITLKKLCLVLNCIGVAYKKNTCHFVIRQLKSDGFSEEDIFLLWHQLQAIFRELLASGTEPRSQKDAVFNFIFDTRERFDIRSKKKDK